MESLPHSIASLERTSYDVRSIKEKTMELRCFIGKIVTRKETNQRYTISKITSPYIEVKTEKTNSSGYPSTYRFETINGDPFTNNLLIFDDSALLEPFMKAYKAYCHTKDAYYEEIGYWMRRD